MSHRHVIADVEQIQSAVDTKCKDARSDWPFEARTRVFWLYLQKAWSRTGRCQEADGWCYREVKPGVLFYIISKYFAYFFFIQAYEARNEAQSKITALKEKNEKEVSQYNMELKVLTRVLEHDRKLKTFMGIKGQDRAKVFI